MEAHVPTDSREATFSKDKTRNERIREAPSVVQEASKKITERRLNWYGHVMRKYEEHKLRKVLRMDIQWKKREDDRKQDGKSHANET